MSEGNCNHAYNRDVVSLEVIELMSDAQLVEIRDDIVRQLPTRSSIFLPTGKIPLREQVKGLMRVRDIYRTGLDSTYRPRLRVLRERFKDSERCFVIGNGPSLNRTDLSVLKGEVTFAVNGFFLKTHELDWLPTFYVVEDHLVAEDRRVFVDAFKGPIKLFPAYLGYCFEASDDTIFFNHRSRPRYPHAFDFSTNAEQITYAGCTVTFTCLQLAHYLGFKKIYLIGVDSDYAIPVDAEQKKDYSVGILDMKSDDPNHFHPDYFGKGFRWHDPQVDKMLAAYAEARRVAYDTGREILNATVGGKLEVFERVAFSSLFPGARCSEDMERIHTVRHPVTSGEGSGLLSDKLNTGGSTPPPTLRSEPQEVQTLGERSRYGLPDKNRNLNGRAGDNREVLARLPRLLLFDITRRGDGTATGNVKATLFSGWPEEHFVQFYSLGRDRVGVDGIAPKFLHSQQALGVDDISRLVRLFAPEVILYRPVPDNLALHEAAMGVIRSGGVALAVWMMDDWPSQLAAEDPELFRRLDSDLRELLARADLRLSICDAMSVAFAERYNVSFKAFANAIDPQDWPLHRHEDAKMRPFVLRYAGALANNMVLDSVRRTAQAVERLASNGVDIRFEITTHSYWQATAQREFKEFKSTSLRKHTEATAYREWLSRADAVLVAYNFDEASKSYTRYSLANKLPECLASGAALIAYGPSDVATIDYIKSLDCAVVVTDAKEEALLTALKGLVEDPSVRHNLSEKARAVAFDAHNVHRIRRALHAEFRAVAARRETSNGQEKLPEYERAIHAHIDETQVISALLAPSTDIMHVMIDVGAHCGSSARHFVDQGWRIYCFEPDPTNRGRLTTLFGDKGNVTIDPRAVSDRVERGKPLFSSPESTGISALHAFRDTHKQTELVDVTNITQIVEEYKLDRIDFLKIDVEGFDFAVLRGVPWDRIKPAVIECEFEDAKTVPLGHTWKEIAEFLVAKGYAVYVSEWHPIVRYGIQHDWCRLFRYPGPLRDPEAWGNLLAFLEDPGPEAMADALSACLKVTHPKPASTLETSPPLQPAGAVVKHTEAIRATSEAVQTKADEARVRNAHENGGCETPTVKETPNARVNVARDQDPVSEKMAVGLTPNADWCRRLVAKMTGEHTMLRPFVKFLEWSAGAIARHWPGVLGAVVVAVSLLGIAFWFAPGLWLYWLAAFSLFTAGGIAFLAIGYGQHFFSCYAARQADELERRSAEIWRLQRDIGRLRSEIVRAAAAHPDELKRDLASVQAVSHATDRALADVRTQIADTLDAVRSRQDALDRTVAAHADEFKRDLASVQAVSHATDRALADVRAQIAADKTVVAEAVDAVRNQDAAFRKLNSSNASLARPFNRFLSPEHIQRLTQYWSKVFGVTMSPSAISYLAHRMCVAEDQCEGRLACSIETAMLRQYALRSLKGDRLDVLEIGALFGLGSAFLYKFTGPEQSGIHLTLIDPLEGYYGSNRLDPSTGIPVDRRTLERNYTTLGIPREAWRLIQRLSTDPVAAQEAADRQYDLVLIDGDHSAAGVVRDYEMYAPMIKPGGLIIFDDYGSGHWPSIQPFVDEYVQPDGRWIWIGAEWNTAILRRRHEEGYVRAD